MTVAGFVCGLVSGVSIFLFGSGAPMIGLCISVSAIVFSAIGLKKDNHKQMAVAGLSFGVVATIYFSFYTILSLILLIQLLLSLLSII